MTLTQAPTDAVTLQELLQIPELFTVTSRFLDIALSTLNRLAPDERSDALTEIEFELFRLSRSIPAAQRRAAWEYAKET